MEETSFMQRMMANPSMHDVFKNLLNPSQAKHGTQLITVHGEHLPGGKKTENYGIKFMLCFLASSGTVNWANEEVNQKAMVKYNAILDTPGFMPYKPAIISGDASRIPTRHTPVPTLDELYLALAFRVSIELEFIDDAHVVQQQTENKIRTAKTLREKLMVSDNESGFTDATKSKERNFSTTLPVYQTSGSGSPGSSPRTKSSKSGKSGSPGSSPRTKSSKSGKSGSPGSPRSKSGFVEPIIIEELMHILRPPIDISHKGEIRDFVTLDQMKKFIELARKYHIVLPTRDCLEKRYSLTARYEEVNENEHESLHTDEDDEIIKDKGYEHKLCLIIPYDGTEGAYETHITSFQHDNYKVENAMRGSASSTISSTPPYILPPSLLVGYSTHIGKHLKTEFNGVATDGHSQASKEWNKCVIVPRDPLDKDIGFFQWKIIDLGGEPHLVVNIWNLISRLEGTMGTEAGGIFISTTSDTLQMCNLMGLEYVTGIDLTCVVPGMRTAGWVILDKNSWDEEVRDVDSQIAHVHHIAVGERSRQHVSAKDINRNICKQLDEVDTMLSMFNAKGDDAIKIGTIVDATLKKTRHGKKYVYDEMFTMHYFFKGITTGPERGYLAVHPPFPVLTAISTHLTKIEEFLLSYHSATTAQKASILTEYKTELRAILSLIKLHKITLASFKVRPIEGEIDDYTALVRQFITRPKALEELMIPEKLKEFTTIVKARLAVLGEDPAKISVFKKFIKKTIIDSTSTPGPPKRATATAAAAAAKGAAGKKGGGKRNKTRKHRHHLKRRTRRIRSSRGLRKRAHTRRRR